MLAERGLGLVMAKKMQNTWRKRKTNARGSEDTQRRTKRSGDGGKGGKQ